MLPASILKALKLKLGDKLLLRVEDGELVLTRAKTRGQGVRQHALFHRRNLPQAHAPLAF